MRFLGLVLVNAAVSVGVSLGVLYWAPGYAPAPHEVIFATNTNTRAISKLSESTLEVIKRMNEIAPPNAPIPVHTGGKDNASSYRKP